MTDFQLTFQADEPMYGYCKKRVDFENHVQKGTWTVKLIQRMKIAHLFLRVIAKLFRHVIFILSPLLLFTVIFN